MNKYMKALFRIILFGASTAQAVMMNDIANFIPGFGTDGYVKITTDYDGNGYAAVNKCVVDSNGKIIVFGQAQDNLGLIVRYNSDGSVDTVFDQDGTDSEVYTDGIIDSDGSILAVGRTSIGVGEPLLVRYNSNGTLAAVFEFPTVTEFVDGLNNGHSTMGSVNGVAVDSEGNIVVVGSGTIQNPSFTNHGFIIKFNSDGSIVQLNERECFILDVDNPTYSSQFMGVCIDYDDNIIVVGNMVNPDNSEIFGIVQRYNGAGVADSTFNNTNNEFQQSDSTRSKNCVKISLDSNGKILVVGSDGSYLPIITRYVSSGDFDSSFNMNSPLSISQIIAEDTPGKVAAMYISNDKIYLMAERNYYNNYIISLNSDGSLNTDFNKIGYLVLQNYNLFYIMTSVVVDHINRIVCVGKTNSDSGAYGIISRFLQTGAIDTRSSWTAKKAKEYFILNDIKTGII